VHLRVQNETWDLPLVFVYYTLNYDDFLKKMAVVNVFVEM